MVTLTVSIATTSLLTKYHGSFLNDTPPDTWRGIMKLASEVEVV